MRKNLLFYLINSKSAKVLLALLFGLNVAMAQVNLAPSATATASTCNSGACSAFNDLVFGTCGTQQVWLTSNATNPGSSVYIQFDWSTPQAIKGMTIHAGQSGTRYLGGGTIQRWNGSSWVTVMAFTQNNTSLCNYDINFPSTVSASKLRIIDIVVIGSQSSNVNFREIEIWQGATANDDVGVSSIDSPGVFCANQQNIYATITNFGTNQVSSFNVNWSINGIVQTPIFYNLTTLDTAGGIGANSVKLQLGSYYFPTGVSTTIKAWTSSPNSQTDTIRTNDTSTVVKMPAMASGTYTIGGVSPNFSTIDSAIMAMELAGICGPVYFNIAPGTYPRTTAIKMGDILGASNINTITFDGGNKLNTRFEGNFTNSAVIVLDKSKYVTLKNITFQNTAISGTPVAIGIVGTTKKITVSNCIARLPVNSGTISTGYCVTITNTANGAGISATPNDSITIDSCRTVGGGYGIAAYGNQQTTTNRGLVFTNNTIDSCNYMGAYIYRNYNPIVLKHNTVNMQGWQYGYYGIYFYYNQSSNTSISHEIIGNRINNFGYYGIYLYYPLQSVSAAPLKFYNNVISSYTGGSYSGYYGVYLYLPTGAYPVNVYHNTILMNGVQTSNTATCFRSQGSTVINIKNNIFAVYSGGYTPLYLATNPTGNVVNYNNYYNATNPVSGYLLYRGSYLTPATYLGASAGGDSSVNVEPSFVNRAATPYANLAMANGCDGQGVNLSADVPTDITGVTRSLTTPTLGAYEFNGNISNNLSVRSLITPVPPITQGYTDLKYLVQNIGNNTVYSYTAAYQNNLNTPVTISQTNTLAPCAFDTASFTGANQINLGVVNLITCYTYGPNSSTDSDPTNDTLRDAFYSPLSGTYTVGGTNPDFATPAAAAAALENGLAGPVVFDIRPGTYTQQVHIKAPIPGVSDSNTITFKGQNKATTIISGGTSSAMFLIDKISYVTVRDLTIQNSMLSAGLSVVGTNTDNSGTGCKVINCDVSLPVIPSGTASNGFVINFTATAGGTGISAMRADSILVDSCTLTGGGYGLVAYGASNVNYNRNLIFRNNTIQHVNYMGAYIYQNYNAIVFDNNRIQVQGFNYGYYGLYFYYNQNSDTSNGHIITRNRIEGFGGYGAYMYYTMGSALAKPTLFANNIVLGNSPSSSYPGVYGVYLYNASPYPSDVLHNTIEMSGAGTATSYTCFYNNGSTGTVIKNNIFSVLNGAYTPAYMGTSPSGNNLNYNMYYNGVNPTSGNLVYRNSVYYTPSNYLSATAGGDSSYNMMPPLDSNYNLTNGCQKGVTTNGLVNYDIVGNPRLLAEPNIGAYEYQGTTLDLLAETMLSPTTPIVLGAQDLSLIVRNNGTNTVYSFNVAYTLNNGTPVVLPWSGTLPACETDTIVFTGLNQITLVNGANNIKVYTYSPNSSADLNPANDTIVESFFPPLNGTYVIGTAPSDFTSFGAAAAALQNRGVGGPVVFNVKTGVYNEQVSLNNAIGASATNTVTFKSMANHVDSVILHNNGGYVVRFNGADHHILDKIGIYQTHLSTQGTAIFVSSMSDYDTVRNCKINAGVYNVGGVTAVHYLVQANPYTGTGLAFINNKFNGGYYGPYIFGPSRTTPQRFTYIDGNTFDSIYYYFMYFYYSVGGKIVNNTYRPHVGGSGTSYLYMYYADSGFQYVNNYWNGNNSNNVYHYLYYSSSKPTERSLIANNRIHRTPLGYFYVGQTGTEYQDVVHNTFYMGTGYFYVGTNVTGNFTIKNNVFSGTGTYAYYCSAAPNPSLMQSDYNLVHTTGSLTPYYASGAKNLAQFRSAYTGLEANSLSYRASFTSTTNPEPLATDSAVWAINGRGTHLSLVPTDANNVTRPATPAQGVPDLGAFEVTPTSIPPLAVAIPDTASQGGTQVFTFGGDTVATIIYDLYQAVPTAVGVRQYTGVRHPQVSPTQNYTNVYNQVTATGLGYYLFTYNMFFKDPQIGTNPSKASLVSALYNNSAWTTYTNGTSTLDSIRNLIATPSMYSFGDFIGTDNTLPLPVTISTFDAKANGKNVLVTWATASEKNASHFELQVSVDGKNFKPIAKVKATGNSNTTKEYNYNHFDAFAIANTLYYRLKSVDVDGESAISKVAIVTLNKATIEDVVVYPNPFTSELTIALPNNEQAQVEIVSLEGVQVLNSKVTADANGMVKMEGLNNLSSGVYFVRITQNGQTTVSKLVKQ